MKTPEELAEEYAKDWHKDCDYPEEILKHTIKATKTTFLAGCKAAQQWISVKDRLPEINKGFIGFAENKEVCNCYRYPDHSEDGRPVFYAQTKTGLLICGLESISHWMPLPAPPKEEKVITSLDEMHWPQKRITVEEAKEMFPDKPPKEEK